MHWTRFGGDLQKSEESSCACEKTVVNDVSTFPELMSTILAIILLKSLLGNYYLSNLMIDLKQKYPKYETALSSPKHHSGGGTG